MSRSRLFRIGRWVALAAVLVCAGIQLIPVERTNPPVTADLAAPAEIDAILRRSCYDCHSHETVWPWYAYVAPVSWWLADHVRKARSDLNFSDWPAFDFEEQEYAFREIEEQIEKGEMPLPNYLILHPEARLSDADRETLLDWARSQF